MQLDDEFMRAYLHLAQAYMDNNEPKLAENILKKAIKKAGQNDRLQESLFYTLVNQKKFFKGLLTTFKMRKWHRDELFFFMFLPLRMFFARSPKSVNRLIEKKLKKNRSRATSLQ